SWMKEPYQLGETPPLGEVPRGMLAQVVRQDRFGEPTRAFKVEQVEVPSELRPDEVLVYVMAAGINYNNVWAALGTPVDVIKARQKAGEKEPFHIGGSDASGIVFKIGSDVRNLKVGDHVVIHCGMWDRNDPVVKSATDPMFGASFRIWGYESNWGSFAQFTKVQAHQCLPKPKHLTWEAAAAYMLVGATAYRMLHGWPPHDVKAGDVVLVWGGAGGEAVGERRSPRIVFEHPGEDTVPTSIFVCDTGGMVVICAGTTGYNATLDLRYHWMRQKRFQGSHFANDEQAEGVNRLVIEGKVDPCLGEAFTFDQVPHTHQMMYENRHPAGNMACLVGAPRKGMKELPL